MGCLHIGMIDTEMWQNTILDKIEESKGVESTIPRREIERVDGMDDFIEVKFEGAVNTLRILHDVEDKLTNHTTIIVRTDRNTVQFRLEKAAERSGNVEGEALIHKILQEDVPVREGFVPNYEIHEGFIMVESPVEKPIELFESMRTRIWNLTGVYEKDGIYNQRFEQFDRENNDDVIEKYGKYRLQNILWDVSVPCPDCGEGVRYSPGSPGESEWSWECDECSASWGPSKLCDILDEVDPLWNRQRIIEDFRQVGMNTVHR